MMIKPKQEDLMSTELWPDFKYLSGDVTHVLWLLSPLYLFFAFQ